MESQEPLVPTRDAPLPPIPEDIHDENRGANGSYNKVIKFPSDNIEQSIKKSIGLLDSEDFANYKIIDLRINDKIIVE